MPKSSYEAALHGLMCALSESAATLSDAEIIDESLDPEWEARDVKQLLQGTLKSFKQRDLRAAKAAYRDELKRLDASRFGLPSTPVARRRLLETVLAQNPAMQTAFLTLQHRDYKSLSDADVESCLQQLKALGVWDEPNGGN